jgi:beta-lactamase family protein
MGAAAIRILIDGGVGKVEEVYRGMKLPRMIGGAVLVGDILYRSLFAAFGGPVLARSADGSSLFSQERTTGGLTIRQIRNATLVVEYAAKRFLVDPMLARKGAYPPFPNSVRQDQRNPLVELPMPAEQVIAGIDAVFLSHLHLDHYDDAARQLLPKGIKVFVQDESDKGKVDAAGFTNVEVLTESRTRANTACSRRRGESTAPRLMPRRSGDGISTPGRRTGVR